MHPERVIGVITLGVPFMLPGPSAVQNHLLPEGFYISRWQVQILRFSPQLSFSTSLFVLVVTFDDFRNLGGQKQILAVLM